MRPSWVDSLRALIRPACHLCGAAAEGPLCSPCRAALPWNRPACERCAQPLTVAQTLCRRCQRRAPAFDRAYSVFRLEAPVEQWIYGIKSRARFEDVALLAGLMAEHCPPASAASLLLPVPLHVSRLRRRGYNQALELARRIARRRDLPYAADALQQVRATRDLTRLSRAARRAEVRGAFRAKAERMAGRDIVLVDDVLTTGATTQELARVCRRAGACSVMVWTAARTA